MGNVSFEDFYQALDLKFDASRLRRDLDGILKKKNKKSLAKDFS